MVLSYLRWEADAAGSFGLVASPQCAGVVFLKTAGLAVAGAGEAVHVWQIKSGTLVQKLLPEGRQYSGVGARARPQVTHLRAHPTQADVAAAGYSDGTVRLWNVRTGKELVALSGHRGLVTALAFSADGSRLYSGGADTDIVCWDVVAESGLFRLKGHKGPITELLLLERQGTGSVAGAGSAAVTAEFEHAHLVSASKDTLVKVWDLATQACVQTLVGHRAEVTALAVTPAENLLVTGAAEGPLRVWRIHPNGRADAPVESTATSKKEKKIIVKIEPGLEQPAAAAASDAAASSASAAAASSSGDASMSTEGSSELLRFWGFLPRDSKRRVTSLSFWPARRSDVSVAPSLLISVAADKQVDLFHVRDQAEVDKKVKRRTKRQKEKAKKHANKQQAGGDADMADADGADGTAANGSVVGSIPIDQFQALLPLRTNVKVVAAAASSSAAHLRLLFAMSDNSLQCWSVDLAAARSSMDEKEAAEEQGHATALTAAAASSGALMSSHYSQLYSLHAPGHRSGIRVSCLNSDGTALLTASGEQVKLWNVASKQCIRTMESGFALCGAFVPGSRHVIIGTKSGELELYDLATGSCIQKVAAHVSESGAPVPVYALDLRPDQKGFSTGGGDKEVKVWDFELVLVQADPDSPPVRSLQVVLVKTLRLTDDVLCIKHSPDGKLIAVGLLDSTIKLFYADSLKFFLSLYGHKLPVLSLDISSDSAMLVSGSADKNVKLWGLDFGDCHKSMFAHQDSVTAVRFLRGTHLFFSAGKDKLVKLWDGDTFEQVQELAGHTAEVWSLAVNAQGTGVVTAGNDKCVRMFSQSDQQLFLEEERETRLEAIYDQGATTEVKQIGAMAGGAMVAQAESALVARTQANDESLQAGERLIEALDLADADRERWLRYDEAVREQKEAAAGLRDGEKLTGLQLIAAQQKSSEPLAVPQANPLLRGPNADAHVLNCLQSIKTPELDEALLVLPFDYACRLLPYLNRAVQAGVSVELCVHALLFLLSAHHRQLVSNQVMLDTLRTSRDQVRSRLTGIKRTIGFNMAAVAFLARAQQEQQSMFRFGDKDSAAAQRPVSAAAAQPPVQLDASKPLHKKRRML